MRTIYPNFQKLIDFFRREKEPPILRFLAKDKLKVIQLKGRLHANALQQQLTNLYSQEEESLFI